MSIVVPFTSQAAVPAPQIVAKRVVGRRTRRRAIALAVMAAIGFGACGLDSARADLITPAGLAPGTTFRYIYVTTATTLDTNAGSASAFNAVVTGDATAQGYDTYNGAPVTWQALISTADENANALIGTNDAFYLPDGTEVAASTAALFNADTTALLSAVGTATNVWTGATTTGGQGSNAGQTFVGNTTNSSKVEVGDSTQTTGAWLDDGNYSNAGSYPLYAFSSEVTVAAVPEPASLGLLAAAVMPLALGRRRRSRKN